MRTSSSKLISFTRPDGKEGSGYLSMPAAGERAPGVVVIQEWWGLNEQIRGVAQRLADAGYRAVASRLHYRYRPVDRVRRPEPILLSLADGTATVEVEVPRTAVVPEAGPETSAGGGGGRRPAWAGFEEVAPGHYEVKRSDVQEMLQGAGRLLANLRPFVLPGFSFGSGVEYKVTSAAGDGLLGAHGFTVYDPKLAARAGIEIGDRILSVNGRKVDGLASLYRLYHELRGNPAVASIQLELERAASRLTKVYKMR